MSLDAGGSGGRAGACDSCISQGGRLAWMQADAGANGGGIIRGQGAPRPYATRPRLLPIHTDRSGRRVSALCPMIYAL
jgi:hypothetical protein